MSHEVRDLGPSHLRVPLPGIGLERRTAQSLLQQDQVDGRIWVQSSCQTQEVEDLRPLVAAPFGLQFQQQDPVRCPECEVWAPVTQVDVGTPLVRHRQRVLARHPVHPFGWVKDAASHTGAGNLTFTTDKRRMVIDRTAPTNLSVAYPSGPWQLGVAQSVTLSADGDPETFRYTLNGVDPTCSTGTEVGAVAGAGTTGTASVNVAPSQAGNNWLRVVACDRATNQSSLHSTPAGTIVTPGAQAWHAWDWDSTSNPAPGTDTGVSSTGLTLTDLPTPDRGPVNQGPRPFNGTQDQWLQLGSAQHRAEAVGSAFAGLSNGFTVSGWVKVDGAVSGTEVLVGQSGPTTDSVRLAATTSGWQIRVSDGEAGAVSVSTLSYAMAGCGPDAWCYVAGVWSPSLGAKVVVVPGTANPSAMESAWSPPGSAPALSGGMIRLGQGQTGISGSTPVLGLPLSGGLDRVRVFNAPMNADDITNAAQG